MEKTMERVREELQKEQAGQKIKGQEPDSGKTEREASPATSVSLGKKPDWLKVRYNQEATEVLSETHRNLSDSGKCLHQKLPLLQRDLRQTGGGGRRGTYECGQGGKTTSFKACGFNLLHQR